MTEPLIPLKPCPFCGKEATLYSEGHYRWARCPHCDAAGPTDLGNSGACEAWNTRPVEAQLLEACKAALEIVADISTNYQVYELLTAAIRAAEGDAS